MKTLLLILTLLVSTSPAYAQRYRGPDEWEKVLDLRGMWRFSIGDDQARALRNYADSDWDEIPVPGIWEDYGYPGYDGFSWYRKHFKLSEKDRNKALYLHLGRIDDVDEVYVNGHFVGSTGRLEPEYETGYPYFRAYPLPAEYLDFEGDNVVAVRVYDEGIEGGIVEGNIGIYAARNAPRMVVDLAGSWFFRPGDDPSWAGANVSSNGWTIIHAPARWEPQGFRNYDGYAWYRKVFTFNGKDAGPDLILVLGNIDDVDEVFINGRLIGSTGDVENGRIGGDDWRRLRAYPLPAGLLKHGQRYVIAVRVFDGTLDGGIYRGPLGIMTRDDYEAHFSDRASRFFDAIFRWFESF